MTQPTRQPTPSRQPKSNKALAGAELAQALNVLPAAPLDPLAKATEMGEARKQRSTGKQEADEERLLSDADATSEGNGQHQAQSGRDSDGHSNAGAWTVAQANTGAGVTDAAITGSASASCDAQNSADCDDDKGLLWWGHGPGAWLKLGLGVVGAALVLGSKSKEEPHAELETSMAAGPFKANGMELHFYGTSGLLLKIRWDAEGERTVQSNTALIGDVRVLSSKVTVNGQDQIVVSGIEVNFATYTGALLAVIFDPSADDIPVEYFDEVAGLIPLDTALRAMTVIKPGQNFLAITPLTELAAQLANVTAFDEDKPEAYSTLLQNKDVVSDLLEANQKVSELVGMDIVNVLPTAVNDSKFSSETDLAAKKYGEILASVSNLVPGNLQAGLDLLANKKDDSEAAKNLLRDSLVDFNSQADATPATVVMTQPGDGNLWINQAESQALTLSGSSQNAPAGSVVWVRLYGTDGKTYQLSARVQDVNGDLNGTWTVTLPDSLRDLGFKDGGLTIQAYIDAKQVASQRYELDASTPQAPSQVPDLYSDEDSGRSNTDNNTSALRPHLHIGALPEAGMMVQLLVNGEEAAANYNAQTGTLTPNQALSEGQLQISYRYTDAAGNTGPTSAALALTVDTTAPFAPDMALGLLGDEDTGRSNFDQNTATHRPALQIGVLPEADLQIELLVNGVVKAATYHAETGTLKPDDALTDGDNTLTYRFVDRAGNRSEPSDPTVLRIDTTAPTVVLQSLTLSQDSGVSSTDWVTQVANQSVRAQLSAALDDGEKLLASLDGGSTWSDITSSVQGTDLVWAGVVLPEGSSSLQWKVVDAAGNEGAVIRQNAMLDRMAPTAPSAAADLQAGSDSGQDSDNNTRATRPVFDIQARPADAAVVELLLNGHVVSARYEHGNGSATLQPTSDLNDGVYAVSYRYADTAGNRSEPSTSLSLTVDTRAPVNSAIQAVASGGFSGTFEAGCDVQLRIAGVAVTGVINTTSGGTWSYVPSAEELGQLRDRTTSDIQLVVTDTAGNISQTSRVATPDDFSGPYIKEYIPADGGKLAYGPDDRATLNVVFSKAIEAVAGSIKVYEVGSDTLIATIGVTDDTQVQITGADGNDVFIRLPAGLNVNSRYYVVIEPNTFKDGNGEFFTGKTQIGTAGWDFMMANAAIAPDFVALDDRINAAENAQVVLVSGKVVASLAILQDIVAGNLTIRVNTPLDAQEVNANGIVYHNETGAFVFNVPAAVWAEGVYGYTVDLAGSSGDALGVTASYTFNQLKVDLTEPTQFAALTSATDDAGSITGELWLANATSAVTDDTSPYLSGTLSANLSDDARVVVYRQDVSNPNNPGAVQRLTGYAGLVPTGNTWSLTDSGLADGTYEYTVYVEDEAGNRSVAGAAHRLTIDTTAPSNSVLVGRLTLSQDTGVSATDWITQTPTQTVTGTMTAALGQDESLWVSQDGGTTWSNITASVSSTTLSWAGVSLQEGQGSLRFQVRDTAGNVGHTTLKDYTLDSTAPVPPNLAPDLLASDDSGSSDNDNITNNTRPHLQVDNLPDGTRVQLLVDGQPVDASYDAGTRKLRPDQVLVEGTHLISYRWVDTAGNASEASPNLSVQIDTEAPLARFTQISLSNDTGSSNTDLVTKTAPQNITAQLSGVVSPTDVVWGSLDSGGTWVNVTDKLNIGGQLRWPGVSLVAGTHSVQFKVLDAAGNTGPISSQTYTLDTTAPTHTMTGIQLSADTGASATDFLTRQPQQTVSGALQLNGVPASLAAGERLMGSANGGISWQDITASLDGSALTWANVTLQNGASSLRFKVLDLAGNESTLSTQTYTLDTAGPAALTGATDLLKDDQDTGVRSTDNITRQSRPTFQVENMPEDAVSAELLINGLLVEATFSADESTPPVITLTPNELLADGTYQVSYRFVDAAGNSGDAVAATEVVIDTRAPVNTALVSFAPGAIAGTYEAGSTLSLKINGVAIDSSRLQLNPTAGTWRLVPTEAELNDATNGLLSKANSTFELTATDAAGNENSNSATVTKDAFNAPYVKEFIPTDGGVLANGLDGKATLNLVFSKAVTAGTGKIMLWNGSTVVAEIDVATATADVLRIVGGNDVFVTLPGLTPDVLYHVTLAAGSFVDANQQPYAGDTLTGEAGWDFVAAVASIAPDFVAQDDRVNLAESGQTVRISGKVTAIAGILRDIEATDLSISVTAPQDANAVIPTLESYDKATGSFIFSVPAQQAWADGQYGYTVSLQGASGNATGVTASYRFDNLGVDLVAPTGIRSSLDGIFDDVGATQGNLFLNNWKLLESGYASTAGTTKVTDINVTDLVLTRLSVTMGGGSLDPSGAKVGIYNSGGTVYNSDHSSVSFWVQFTDDYTKAVKLQLNDTANGIQLKVLAAKYLPGPYPITYNWNSGGTTQSVATSGTARGYGVSSLQFVGDNMSDAMLGSGYTDDNTPTLRGTLTRPLGMGERIAIDRTDEDGNTVTVTGAEGLIVQGTSWAFTDKLVADGRYTYKVYVEDLAGNRSVASPARTITVDAMPPETKVLTAALSADTGSSNSDGLTNVANQTLSGTLDEALQAGEKLMLSLNGGVTWQDITHTVSGTAFSGVAVTLSPGEGKVMYRVVDRSGLTGPVHEQAYTLDTVAPVAATVNAQQVEFNGAKVIEGTAQLATGDRLTVSVNGAVYAVTPDAQGAWTLDLSSANAQSGTLGQWTGGTRYDVVATVTDAAGNSTVDASAGELRTLAEPPTPLQLDTRSLTAGPVAQMFGNVLMKQANGSFAPTLGVTVLDDRTTYASSIERWDSIFGSTVASNRVYFDPWFASVTVNAPYVSRTDLTNYGYALRLNSATSNTPEAIAQFLRTNQISASSPTSDMFYLVINVDNMDGSGLSGSVVVYVNERLNTLPSIDPSIITIVSSHVGRTAAEFSATDFKITEVTPYTNPIKTIWIDGVNSTEIVGTAASDRLMDGYGSDVIRGNGGKDFIALVNDYASDTIVVPLITTYRPPFFIQGFYNGAVVGTKDQLDLSEFGFYREHFQNSGLDAGPAGNVSGKVYVSANLLGADRDNEVNNIADAKYMFIAGYLTLDENSEGIVIFGNQSSAWAHAFYVSDSSTEAGIQLNVLPLFGMVLDSNAGSLTAENITARSVEPEPQDYISIGRLAEDKSAFGAWFDTDEDGVYDAGEELVGLKHGANWDTGSYHYTLDGIDFASGSYTVRFVDVLMSDQGTESLVVPDGGSFYGPLKLGDMGFGGDDKVIIDMETNAMDWMGMDSRSPFSVFDSPTSSRSGNTIGTYGDGKTNLYNDPVTTGLFGQLSADTRPADNLSPHDYARLEIFVEDATSSQVSWEAFKYVPPTTRPNGGTIGTNGVLVDLGVPVTALNLEIMVQTTFIA